MTKTKCNTLLILVALLHKLDPYFNLRYITQLYQEEPSSIHHHYPRWQVPKKQMKPKFVQRIIGDIRLYYNAADASM